MQPIQRLLRMSGRGAAVGSPRRRKSFSATCRRHELALEDFFSMPGAIADAGEDVEGVVRSRGGRRLLVGRIGTAGN